MSQTDIPPTALEDEAMMVEKASQIDGVENANACEFDDDSPVDEEVRVHIRADADIDAILELANEYGLEHKHLHHSRLTAPTFSFVHEDR